MLDIKKEKLIFHYDTEEVWIEPWGANALRVRATKEHKMPEEDWHCMSVEMPNAKLYIRSRGQGLPMEKSALK